jgi:hypothetical protein
MIAYTVLYSYAIPQPIMGDFFQLPGLMMSKVYSNSMLALFNNRATILGGRNDCESIEFLEVSAREVDGAIELRVRSQNSTASTHI